MHYSLIYDLLNLPILRNVLLYHVVPGYLFPCDIETGRLETLRPDLQSWYINTDDYNCVQGFSIDGVYIIDNQNDKATVIIGNVETKNGVVNVVDRVLVPLFSDIMQIATSFDDYTILVQLVHVAGLTDLLSDPNSGPFTVFAPNNNAFYKLMDEIDINIDDLIDLPILEEVLFYHILSGYFYGSQLPTGDYKTLYPDEQTIYINTDNYDGNDGLAVSGIYIVDQQHDDRNVIIGNVEASNGVVMLLIVL